MTKSQNTKNEQQKDLCITSEQLTEQWKKGQLEAFRWYYVKFKTGEIDICWYTEWSNDELGTGGQYFDGVEDENITEVLAPVPSYDEWKEYQELDEDNKRNNQLAIQFSIEVDILKELLEWCRDELFEIYSDEVSHPEDVPIIKKLNEVLK